MLLSLGIFTFFVKEMLATVGDLGENQCRYNAKDDQGCGLDTIKIIEKVELCRACTHTQAVDGDRGFSVSFILNQGV